MGNLGASHIASNAGLPEKYLDKLLFCCCGKPCYESLTSSSSRRSEQK